MPIDPSIALQSNVAPLPGLDFGNALRTGAQMLQLREQQQQFHSQNALRGILSQPGAIGPDGNPTQAALQQVMGVDPNYGMKLHQNALISQEHQMQFQNNQLKRQEMLQELVDPVRAAAMDAYTKTNGTEEAKREAGQRVLNEGLDEVSRGGGLSEQEKQNMNRGFDPARISMMSERWQTYQKYQAELARQKRTEERLEYDEPKEMQWTDGEGKTHREMLQYNKAGEGWVTADTRREKVPFQVTPYKAPAPGSVAETRTAIADDVAADPDFKDKSPGARAQETEMRLKVAQGQLASPDAQKAIAQGIASYELAPMSSYSISKSGSSGAAIMADVLKLNPDYEAGRFAERNRVMVEFGSGKTGATVRSINVAVQHLGVLEKAAEALKNGDMRTINQIGNSIAAWSGQPAPTTFDGLKRIIGTEIEKAVAGSAGALADREDLIQSLSRDNSPAQLIGPNGTIAGFKKLMAGQAQGLKRQYEDGTGFGDNSPFAFNKKLMPDTAKELGLLDQKDGGTKDGGSKEGSSISPKLDGLPPDQREAAISYLRAHPETAPQFEKTFDAQPGSAAKILGDQKGGDQKGGDQKEQKKGDTPAAQPSGPREGATAINRKTGQRLTFKGGQWVPLAAAPSAPTN